MFFSWLTCCIYTHSVGMPHKCTTIAILAQAFMLSILNFVLKNCCSEAASSTEYNCSEVTSSIESNCSEVTRSVGSCASLVWHQQMCSLKSFMCGKMASHSRHCPSGQLHDHSSRLCRSVCGGLSCAKRILGTFSGCSRAETCPFFQDAHGVVHQLACSAITATRGRRRQCAAHVVENPELSRTQS